ncbi:hypothetical protein ACIG87_08835 [Micromonospora sp. NPDC051925]|uniref:hypothetical protein n=1 Tax=Micromonospora sp. NPDC051925 TaxID=3364288 RepID=UPI0037C7A97C
MRYAPAGPGQRGAALTVALDHHRPDQEVFLCRPLPMVAGARPRLPVAGTPAGGIHLPGRFTG